MPRDVDGSWADMRCSLLNWFYAFYKQLKAGNWSNPFVLENTSKIISNTVMVAKYLLDYNFFTLTVEHFKQQTILATT